MTTLKANTAKTYATVVVQACTPHIQDQKAAGTPKGITVIQCLTKIVDTVKLTTARSYQGTTGSPMGVVNVPKMQQEDAKAMLHKALYEIFDVKPMTITPESKDPIQVNTVCFKGRYTLATQVNQHSTRTPLDHATQAIHRHCHMTNSCKAENAITATRRATTRAIAALDTEPLPLSLKPSSSGL